MNFVDQCFLYLSAVAIVKMDTAADLGPFIQSSSLHSLLRIRSYQFEFLKHVERIEPTKFRRLYSMSPY